MPLRGESASEASRCERPATRAAAAAAVHQPVASTNVASSNSPTSDTLLGISAARRVYDTLEVRYLILSLLDDGDLARMLRVAKGITASVAGVLYREVDSKQVARMSRATPRRAAYCDAVCILDRNPPPLFHHPSSRRKSLPLIPFDTDTFLTSLAAWRKKFPNLSQVNYLYPSNEADDAYKATIDGDGKITLHLETRVIFDVLEVPFSTTDPPSLPPAPAVEGVTVHHTIAIRMISRGGARDWESDELLDSVLAWRRWLYANKELDRRVTNIDHHSAMPKNLITVDFAGMLDFLRARYVESKSESLTHTYLHIPSTMPLKLFVDITGFIKNFFGRSLRSVTISKPYLHIFDQEVAIALALLAQSLPVIERLTILEAFTSEDDLEFAYPLHGMPTLRVIDLAYEYDGGADGGDDEKDRDSLDYLARYLCWLGRRDCAYRVVHPALRTVAAMERFSARIRQSKSTIRSISEAASAASLPKLQRAEAAILQLRDAQPDFVNAD